MPLCFYRNIDAGWHFGGRAIEWHKRGYGDAAFDYLKGENIEKQTFADECFDIVITQDVMEHIFEPEPAYREIWRTLRPGGRDSA